MKQLIRQNNHRIIFINIILYLCIENYYITYYKKET